jgi:hypothetical protein
VNLKEVTPIKTQTYFASSQLYSFICPSSKAEGRKQRAKKVLSYAFVPCPNWV